MKKLFLKNSWMLALAAMLCAAPAMADDTINIVKPVDINKFAGLTPPTPISITGFSGEVLKALNFDLTVMGFIQVTPDLAQYALSGSNTGEVQGQLSFGKSVIFSKAYSGASQRAQAHRLADDVVLKLTGVKGIASTRVASKVYNIRAGVGTEGEIFISDYDGYNGQAVTRDACDMSAPCWVPGRLALYYTSYKLGNPDLFYQNLSTGNRQVFARYAGMNTGAAVAKDGRVAMTLSKMGSPDVFVCNADGSGLKQLSFTHEASAPCWSPDDKWICFTARSGGRLSLYKVSAAGGEPERIRTDGVGNPSEPDWSPDGKWIAFTSHMSEFSICIIPATGGSAVPLVSGEDPSWSPNSRTLIFVKRDGDNRRLSVLDVPTKQVKDAHRVSGSYLNNSQPSWAR